VVSDKENPLGLVLIRIRLIASLAALLFFFAFEFF